MRRLVRAFRTGIFAVPMTGNSIVFSIPAVAAKAALR
jgi:uncharacterized membrane protein YoaK (UPF0700 family)